MIADDVSLELRLARNDRDLLAAQRLRYQVFVTELGGDGPLVTIMHGWNVTNSTAFLII